MSLFLAVWPDPPTVAQLAGLDRPQRQGVRWTDSGHWHVTLAFLADADASAAQAALAAVGPHRVPRVELGPDTRLLNRTVLVAPASGLDQLARSVADGCRRAGLVLEERPFRGHLTLARGRRPGDLNGLEGEPISAGFDAAEVDLVSSTPVRGGGPNRYEVVGRHRLVPPGHP